MRDVAPAVHRDAQAPGSRPGMRPAKPSSSLLPNVTSDCQSLCERACQAGAVGQDSGNTCCFRSRPAKRGDAATRHETLPGGNFCRAIYRPINHTGSGCMVLENRSSSVGEQSPCASTDRTEPHWRRRRQARAAPLAARSASSEQEAPRNSTAAASLRSDFGGIDALIALQGSKTRPSARSARSKRAQRARRARRAQARPARRQASITRPCAAEGRSGRA